MSPVSVRHQLAAMVQTQLVNLVSEYPIMTDSMSSRGSVLPWDSVT